MNREKQTTDQDQYLQKNLQFVINKNQITDLLKTAPQEKPAAEATDQNPDYQFHQIRYHSARDPYREAQRQLDATIKQNTRHIICIGAGLAFLPELALKNPAIESLLLLECDPQIIYPLLTRLNWKEPAKQEQRLQIYFSQNPKTDNLEDILPFFRNKRIDQFAIYFHRPAHQALPEQYKTLKTRLLDILEKRNVNQATIIKFQDLWNKNITLNIAQLLTARPLKQLLQSLENKYRNILIVGAGPSLQQSIPQIKQTRKKVLIIAADTAFIPLQNNGINPDIVIAADPQLINRHFTYHPQTGRQLWVLDPVVAYPLSHRLRQTAAPIYYWDNPFYLDNLIREQTGNRGEIAHGGSVTTNAFDLARRLKPQKIILIGQDLSFTHGLAHTKGAALETQIFTHNDRLTTMENHNYRQLTALEPRHVQGNSRPQVTTNDKMLMFIKWFTDQAPHTQNIQLYNATPVGAKLAGFTDSNLIEILNNESDQPDIQKILSNDEPQQNDNKNKVNSTILKLGEDINKLKKLYLDNIGALKKMKAGQNKQPLIDRINKNHKEIIKYAQANEIISLNAQKEILNITEGAASEGNSSSNDNEETLYQAMYLGAKKMLYLITKMKNIIHSL